MAGTIMFAGPEIISAVKAAASPYNAGLCVLKVSHCSMNIATNNAVIANSMPVVLKVISNPISRPIVVPVTQKVLLNKEAVKTNVP